MRSASQTFEGGMNSVRDARRFLGAMLREWGLDEYDFGAPQVVSELATNAALHARSTYTLALHVDEDCLLVEVTDASSRLPRTRNYALDATTGRGMGLVAALSEAWGTTRHQTGKTVWARVLPDGALLHDLDLAGLGELDLVSGDDSVAVPESLPRPSRRPRGLSPHLQAKAS